MLTEIVQALEANCRPQCVFQCEPQLGKRGLYPSLSTKETRKNVGQMMDLIAYSDGKRDLIGIAEKIESYVGDLIPILVQLMEAGVIKRNEVEVVN
jgi:aminopeptidase-like protein